MVWCAFQGGLSQGGGVTGNYWDYPTESNAAPTANGPPGGVNFANYNFIGTCTEVGAYSQSASAYGTFDQGGNAWEMNETPIPSMSSYSLRGGAKNTSATYLAASGQEQVNPSTWDSFKGFRVASIHAPLGAFNANGTVDAADYVVWRKTIGTPEAYNLWRAHLGETSGNGAGTAASAALPEPATLFFFMTAVLAMCFRQRGRLS